MKTKQGRAKRSLMYKFVLWRRWNAKDGLRYRMWALFSGGWAWYDWGHRVMVLVGHNFGGNWSEPTAPTWWYKQGPPKSMWRTKYPIHPLSTYEIIKDYRVFSHRTEGLNEDEMYDWKALCVDQDGELQLGKRYWGGNFYGLTKADCNLLRKYLRHWRRLDWYGLRSWLYSQGLQAAVYTKKPFACNEAPPSGVGGYTHWLCQKKRKHDGLHQYKNYAWGELSEYVEKVA